MRIMKFFTKTFFIFAMLSLIFINAEARTIYIDSNSGSDLAYGNKANPYRTIQKGCDEAVAGDIIVVRTGVYYGPVYIKNKGTAEKPITIQGQKGTIITNADKTLRENVDKNAWTLEDEELQLYSAPLELDYGDTELVTPNADGLFPTRVLYDDVDLLQYPSLDFLKRFVLNDNENYYLDGYPHGYFYDAAAKKIYVRLRADGKYGSPNPNDHTMKISPSYYTQTSLGMTNYGLAPGEGSFNIVVGEEGTMSAPLAQTQTQMPSFNVIIQGFTFETPGLAAVCVRASDVTVRNCDFYGCRFGVKGATRVYYDMAYSKNITVEKCDYTQYPTYDDAEEFIKEVKAGRKKALDYKRENGQLEYSWWHKKSSGTDSYGIPIDLRYEMGGLVGNMGDGWVIRNNYTHNVFEGMSLAAMNMYYEKRIYDGTVHSYNTGATNIKIYNNKFERCIDDCIELEENGKNIEIYENEFIDNFRTISWQPRKGYYPTNIYVHHNLIYNTPEYGKFWSQTANYATAAFKIGAQTTNWTFPWSPEMPASGERAEVELLEDGMQVYNNTMILPYGYPIMFSISNKDNWAEFNPIFKNMHFRNNAVISHVKKKPNESYKWDGVGASAVGGVGSYVKNDMGINYSKNVFAPDMNDGYVATDFTENGGAVLENIGDFKFNALTRMRYDIGAADTSPLYDISSDEYAGAVKKGESYVSPSTGREKQ